MQINVCNQFQKTLNFFIREFLFVVRKYSESLFTKILFIVFPIDNEISRFGRQAFPEYTL